MARNLQLQLTDAQRECLQQARDHHPCFYARERAAALLKVEQGFPGYLVARLLLNKPRKPDSVYAWVHRYQTEGIAALQVRPGRGRKPAFSPSVPERGAG